METAVVVYGATAGLVAIAAPVTAYSLDRSGRFPILPILGVSLITGFGGLWAAMALSTPHGDDPCGGDSDLYEEHVVLYDLFPLVLAAAPTLIAWPLSGASFDPAEQHAQLGLGAVVAPERGALIFARLRL